MAARRLLIVMLVLLGLSTLAAALVPPRTTEDEDATTGTTAQTEPVPAKRPAGGSFVPGVVAIEPKGISLLSVNAGDQVQLAVCWSKSDEVEVPSFGLVDPVAPAKPARFDLLFEEPGTYGVKLVSADRVVARIKVGQPRPADELGTVDPDRLTGRERRCAQVAGFL
jgi:hypothetical protein